jgi:hypothetical protein
LKSLAKDLVVAGFRVRKPRRRNDGWKFTPPSSLALALRLRAMRTKQISGSNDFIRRLETRGALMLLGDGRSIDPIRIRPQIKICGSSGDHDGRKEQWRVEKLRTDSDSIMAWSGSVAGFE